MFCNYLYCIGVLRVLFNPTYGIYIDRSGSSNQSHMLQVSNKAIEERKNREKDLLVQLWAYLTNGHLEYIEKSTVLDFIKLVFKPEMPIALIIEEVKKLVTPKSSLEEDSVSKNIQTHSSRSKSPSYKDHHTESWTIEKIIREFIALNETKMRGEMYDFLRIKQIVKSGNQPKYSFTPTLNPRSIAIDRLINTSQLDSNIDESIAKIHYRTKRSSSGSPVNKTQWKSQTNENNKSSFIEIEEPTRMTRHAMLFEMSKTKCQFNDMLIRQAQKEQMKECTFRPYITNHSAQKHKGNAVKYYPVQKTMRAGNSYEER